MVKIKSINEIENNDSVELFDNNNVKLGIMDTGLQLQDVCVQIKEQNLEGYYIVYQNEKIKITNKGRVFCNGKRPFSSMGNLLRRII